MSGLEILQLAYSKKIKYNTFISLICTDEQAYTPHSPAHTDALFQKTWLKFAAKIDSGSTP